MATANLKQILANEVKTQLTLELKVPVFVSESPSGLALSFTVTEDDGRDDLLQITFEDAMKPVVGATWGVFKGLREKVEAKIESVRGRMIPLEKPKRQGKLKVFGGHLDGRTRCVVACSSIAKCAKLTGASVYYIETMWCVTGNAQEIELAMASPEKLLISPVQ